MSPLAKYVAIMFAIDMGIYLVRFLVGCAKGGSKAKCEKA